MTEPASEELLLQLVDQLADAVIIAAPDGVITYWNDAATRLFGWSAEEAVGASLDLIIPERLRARHWSGWDRVMETGVTSYGDRLLQVPALRRDGEPLSIAFTVTLLHPDGETRPTAIAAVLRDDTERYQEHRRLMGRLKELETAVGDNA